MDFTTTKQRLSIPHQTREQLFDMITYLFIALFIYTASSKILTFHSFVLVLGKSPLLGKVNSIVAYLIPAVEIVLSGLLLFNKTKTLGLSLSLVLMTIFTTYLIYMVSLGGKLPCMCGGVITRLTWQQHIWFNIFFIVLAITGTAIYHPKRN